MLQRFFECVSNSIRALTRRYCFRTRLINLAAFCAYMACSIRLILEHPAKTACSVRPAHAERTPDVFELAPGPAGANSGTPPYSFMLPEFRLFTANVNSLSSATAQICLGHLTRTLAAAFR